MNITAKTLKSLFIAALLTLSCFAIRDTEGLAQSSFLPFSRQQLQKALIPYQANENGTEYDSLKPINSKVKTPLILIHGVGPDKGPYFNWQNFLNTAARNHLSETHDIYFYHFNPRASVKKTGRHLKSSLKEFILTHPQKLQILALSQGGLIAKEAYEDSELSEHIQTIITIGTPFHGTPLATKEWMEAVDSKESVLSLFRLFFSSAHAGSSHRLPNFSQDYCWDNIDRTIPPEIRYNCDAPTNLGPYPYPFITYASFFNSGYQEENFLRDLLELPDNTYFKPENNDNSIFSRQYRFDKASKQMAEVPTFPPKSGIIQPFSFNDGVTPIHSALWMQRWRADAKQHFWPAIRRMRGTRMARLFRGLDHQNWMTGNTRTGETQIMDWLHPDEPAKSGFQWIVEDLKRTAPKAVANTSEELPPIR